MEIKKGNSSSFHKSVSFHFIHLGSTSAHLSRPLLIPHQANVLKEKVPNDGKDDRQRDGDQATAPKEETEHGEEGGDAVEDHQRGHQTDVVLLNAVEHQQVKKSADDCARPKTVGQRFLNLKNDVILQLLNFFYKICYQILLCPFGRWLAGQHTLGALLCLKESVDAVGDLHDHHHN